MAFVGSRAELDRANALLAADKLHEGIAALLRAAAAQETTAKAKGVAVKFSGGVSCERVLQSALKKLEADPYLALNIPHESDQATIKKAYRRLALRFHPDKSAHTSVLFQAGMAAYQLLCDAARKRAYDRVYDRVVAKKRRADAARQQMAKERARAQAQAQADARQAAAEARAEAKARSSSSEYKNSSSDTSAKNDVDSDGYDHDKWAAGATKRAHAYATAAENLRHASTGQRMRGRSHRGGGENAPPNAAAGRAESDTAHDAHESTAYGGHAYQHTSVPRPSGVVCTSRTRTSVTLRWRAPSSACSAYQLQWRIRRSMPTAWHTASTLVRGITCRKKHLGSGCTYEFRVRAASSSGWSGFSSVAVASTAPDLPPEPPATAPPPEAQDEPEMRPPPDKKELRRQREERTQREAMEALKRVQAQRHVHREKARQAARNSGTRGTRSADHAQNDRRRDDAQQRWQAAREEEQRRQEDERQREEVKRQEDELRAQWRRQEEARASRSAKSRLSGLKTRQARLSQREADDARARVAEAQERRKLARELGLDAWSAEVTAKLRPELQRGTANASAEMNAGDSQRRSDRFGDDASVWAAERAEYLAQQRAQMEADVEQLHQAGALRQCRDDDKQAAQTKMASEQSPTSMATSFHQTDAREYGQACEEDHEHSAHKSATQHSTGVANGQYWTEATASAADDAEAGSTWDQQGASDDGAQTEGLDEGYTHSYTYVHGAELDGANARMHGIDNPNNEADAPYEASAGESDDCEGDPETLEDPVDVHEGGEWYDYDEDLAAQQQGFANVDFAASPLSKDAKGVANAESEDESDEKIESEGAVDGESESHSKHGGQCDAKPEWTEAQAKDTISRTFASDEKDTTGTIATAAYDDKSTTADAKPALEPMLEQSKAHARSEQPQSAEAVPRKQSSYTLNVAATAVHNVRLEPSRKSAVVGHLVAGREIVAFQKEGNWLRVRWHKRYRQRGGSAVDAQSKGEDVGEDEGDDVGEGWALIGQGRKTFLLEVAQAAAEAKSDTGMVPSESSPSSSQTGPDVASARRESIPNAMATWQELVDPESGHKYFLNTATGESQWEVPLWIDEVDTTSGAVYYVNTKSGETQWDKPFGFVPVVRHRDGDVCLTQTPEGSEFAGESTPDLDSYMHSHERRSET